MFYIPPFLKFIFLFLSSDLYKPPKLPLIEVILVKQLFK